MIKSNQCFLIEKIYNGALKYIMNSTIIEIIPTSKYLSSWNLCPKPNLAITFWAPL